MKSAWIIAGLLVGLSLGLVVTQKGEAGAQPVSAAQVAAAPSLVSDLFHPEAEAAAKSCSFSSDCSHGICKSGTCGGCNFTSECKGWGKCDKGWCGACSFSSECQGFGTCSGGKCTQSPY